MVVRPKSRHPVYEHGRSFREWNIGGTAFASLSGEVVTPFGRLSHSFFGQLPLRQNSFEDT